MITYMNVHFNTNAWHKYMDACGGKLHFYNSFVLFFGWPLQLSPTTFLLFNVFSLSFSLVTSLIFNWLFHHFFFIIIIIFFILLTFFIIFIYFKFFIFFTFLKLTFGHPPLNCCITFKKHVKLSNGLFIVSTYGHITFSFFDFNKGLVVCLLAIPFSIPFHSLKMNILKKSKLGNKIIN